MRHIQFLAIAAAMAFLTTTVEHVDAGGSWGGSSGGSGASTGGASSGGGGLLSRLHARHSGSSGGSASSGGGGLLSRLHARHSGGSSGGGASSGGGGLLSRLKSHSGGSHGGSSGGSSYTSHHVSSGSSGGSSGGRVGPIRRLMSKLHSHRSRGSSGGSGGSGSSGGSVNSYAGGGSSGSSVSSYAGGGSSGGSVSSYAAPVQTVSYAPAQTISYGAQAAPVQTISYGASAYSAPVSSYESPVIQSSYQTYTPMGETVIDNGSSMNGTIIDSSINAVPLEGSSLEGGSLGTETIIDSARYESSKPAVEEDAAVLTVTVPDDAVVTVNGHPTTSDGDERQFMSRGLKDGYVYTYIVKVTYEQDGEEKTESKSVKLRRGDVERLEFEAPSVKDVEAAKPAEEDVVTVVRLRVPADAQVSLAGNATAGSGSVRTFRTKQLKSGQQWTDYTVRVTANVHGRSISKERTINVVAGSTNDLSFDFDGTTVATR